MKKYPILLAAIAVLLMAYMGCKKQPGNLTSLTPHLPDQPYDYVSALTANVITLSGDNTPQNNPLTNNGATLGRVLFYDPQLSLNNSLSCGGCHKQQFAFADNAALSEGFQSQKTIRNVPGIINASTKSTFFWDGRTNKLESQTLMPIQNHLEMGFVQLELLPEKLAKVSYYPNLFTKAFGSSEITPEKISQALAQFLRSIVSGASDFDKGQLSVQEQRGFTLFADSFTCTNCHLGVNFGGAPSFGGYNGGVETFGNGGGGFNGGGNGGGVVGPGGVVFGGGGFAPGVTFQMPDTLITNASNIGLDRHYTDGGIGDLLHDNTLNGYFIIPSLRNLALTAPYMHDGRYATLEQVVEHYNSGIQPETYLDPQLTQAAFAWRIPSTSTAPMRFNMSAQQKSDLVAFLKSLTDYSIASDPRYSNPFK